MKKLDVCKTLFFLKPYNYVIVAVSFVYTFSTKSLLNKIMKKLTTNLAGFIFLLCCSHYCGYAQNFIDKYLSDPLIYTTIANSSNNINKPRDLEFKPNTNELWVVNYGANSGGNVVILYNAGQSNQTSQYRKDSHSSHFMLYPSALAFSDNGEWGSTSEIKNTGNANSTFMGPSLWSGDTSIMAKVCQNNWVSGYPLGSHLDMLHQSPFAMGIASDSAKVFWVFDGWNSNICRYDFNIDHSPGYDNHSSGKIWRYSDVSVLRAVGIPSHMALDRTSRWLYIVDAGNKRLMKINTNSGTIVGNLTAPNEPLTLYKNVTGATQSVIASYTSQPTGVDYYDNRLIVSDYMTGDISIYNTSAPTPTLMGVIATGQPGIMGVKIGTDGKIWFVNNTLNTVVRIDPTPASLDAAILSIISPAVENTEPKFYSPAYNVCASSISPMVILKNSGNAVLNSTSINYQIDGGTVITYTWTGSLVTGSTATVTLPSIPLISGTHKLIVSCSNPNGSVDLNMMNDKKVGSFRSQPQLFTLPFTEDFSAAAFPPSGWSYIGYNKFCYMQRNASVGGFGASSGSLKMDNFTGADNITGQKDYFVSSRIDFSQASPITLLTFDLAYAQRNSTSTDKLDVSVSTDCGYTWISIYSKAGAVLSTGSAIGSAYTPTPEEWRTDSLDLGTYSGTPELMVMFTTNSNWGNNIFIDNINITSFSTVGIHKNYSAENLTIFPNPSSGEIKIAGLTSYEEIRVSNVIGQEIMVFKPTVQANGEVVIDLSSIPQGSYILSVKTEGKYVIKKMIISRN